VRSQFLASMLKALCPSRTHTPSTAPLRSQNLGRSAYRHQHHQRLSTKQPIGASTVRKYGTRSQSSDLRTQL